MIKITFLGAGSTVFARNLLGDCMCTPALCEAQLAAMLDPHTAAELSIRDIKAMVDELLEAHGPYMEMYK